MASTEEGHSAGLRWTTERQQGLSTVRLRGELDLSAAETLQAHLEDVAAASPVTVADLQDLEFMDSSGLRVLARVHQASQGAGARFLLGRPSPAVLRVLQVSGLVDHFDYVEGAPPRERACPVCDEWMASNATPCPHCGSPI